MSSKIYGVPRELLEDMLNPCADFATHDRLRALLDAPVVERQPPHQNHDCCTNCMHGNDAHTDSGRCPAPYTTVWNAWDYDFAPDNAPPELAELHATIARLTEEKEQLQLMLNEETDRVKIAVDLQQKAIRGRDTYAAEIERLRGGQGDPVEWRYRFTSRGELSKWFPVESYMKLYVIANDPRYEVQSLYASQSAPVSVVLPERKDVPNYQIAPLAAESAIGWNACLDKIKELNQ